MTLLWQDHRHNAAVYQVSSRRWTVQRAGELIGDYRLTGETFDPDLPPEPVLTITGSDAGTLDTWLRFIPPQYGITRLRLRDRIIDTAFFQPVLPELRDAELSLHCTRRDAPDIARGFTACDYFDLFIAGKRAGSCSLRTGYHPSLMVNGHIGYTVFPAFRGHHYAARAVRLLLTHARTWNMPEVSICCVPENAASRRTCEIAGLSFDGIFDIPPEHALYAQGKRQFCRYMIDLT